MPRNEISEDEFMKLPEKPLDLNDVMNVAVLDKLIEIFMETRIAPDTYFKYQFYAIGTLGDSRLSDRDKVKRLFRYVVADRAGKPSRPYKDIIREFDGKLEKEWSQVTELLNNEKVQLAHSYILEKIEDINDVGQKIANLLLKYVVYYHEIWPQMEQVLFLPVDYNVTTRFFKKLRALDSRVSDHYLYKPRSSDKTFKKFQEILKNVATKHNYPRIVFDNLWFINHFYCSASPAKLCNLCPVGGQRLCGEEDTQIPSDIPLFRK